MASSQIKQLEASDCFAGRQLRCQHSSEVLNCQMTFSLYLPPQANSRPVPVLYWLSGLTCTDENFVTKAGAQQYAAKYGIAIVCPDTSPRGDRVPDDPEGAYDLGLGAGFYVNATQQPWVEHYQMYEYIVSELPTLINAEFPLEADRQSISGHSMGGHGALTIALKNPGRFRSVSAFAPICAPSDCAWGKKAFSHYLGSEKTQWAAYDSVALVKASSQWLPVLVDQGEADAFLADQLATEQLVQAAEKVGFPMRIRMQSGYDHSYFFIATFIGEHIAFHAEFLSQGERDYK